MFIAALFLRAKRCKQRKCPSTDKCPWTDKQMWYSHTLEYSAISEKEVPTHATVWMNLEHIMLNDKKPITKDHILCVSIYVKCPE